MKKKINFILLILLWCCLSYEIGCYLQHVHNMRKLEELKAKVEILHIYSQYELNDLELQKNY